MADADKLATANASADDAPPAPSRRRRTRKQTTNQAPPAVAEAPPAVQAPRNLHTKVRVRNLTKKKITTPTGSLKPQGEGMVSLLDAQRLRNYMEIIDG